MATHGLQQAQSARDVGLDERFRAPYRAIHVALGGEMRESVDRFSDENVLDQGAIKDRAPDEAKTRVAMRGGKVGEIARVSQRIEHHDPLNAAVGQQMTNKIGADKA